MGPDRYKYTCKLKQKTSAMKHNICNHLFFLNSIKKEQFQSRTNSTTSCKIENIFTWETIRAVLNLWIHPTESELAISCFSKNTWTSYLVKDLTETGRHLATIGLREDVEWNGLWRKNKKGVWFKQLKCHVSLDYSAAHSNNNGLRDI